MAKSDLTRVQVDCLEAKGICDGCPNNILESGPCRVKFSKGVARKLGLKEIKPTDIARLASPITKTCGFCGHEFAAWYRSGKYCTQCAAKRQSTSESLRMCKRCGHKFFSSSSRSMCHECGERRASA